MFAFEHRRQFTARWAWMVLSGIVVDVGRHHHFRFAWNIRVDDGSSYRDQHDPGWGSSHCDGIGFHARRSRKVKWSDMDLHQIIFACSPYRCPARTDGGGQ
jgi:hypothetical protein